MKKNKITGLVGTLVLHTILLILLFLIAIRTPKAQEEGGVPVMLGEVPASQGNADPYTLTDVDIWEEPEIPTEVAFICYKKDLNTLYLWVFLAFFYVQITYAFKGNTFFHRIL